MGRIVSSHHLTAAEKGESSRDAERSEQIAQAPTDEAADAGALVLVSQPPGSERRQHDISDDEAGGGFHEEGSREGAEADEELALLEAAFEADEVGELLSPCHCHAVSECSTFLTSDLPCQSSLRCSGPGHVQLSNRWFEVQLKEDMERLKARHCKLQRDLRLAQGPL